MASRTETGDRDETLIRTVRERYGEIARRGTQTPWKSSGACCSGGGSEAEAALKIGYGANELAQVPEGSNLGLGCGAPIRVLGLRQGETVVDLGSGAGFDAFLAAREVGPSGRVIGVDMTSAMLERARSNARGAGIENVEFREGRLEALPVDDGSVDAVTSNCVINLVPDKRAVFREIARVLRPGGRLAVSDIVLDGELPAVVASDLLAYSVCIAGASRRDAYFALLREAGLEAIEIHRDIDYLAAFGFELPGDLAARLEAEGTSARDLEGIVRSVTFTARRSA